jgi:hypothetical protein
MNLLYYAHIPFVVVFALFAAGFAFANWKAGRR